jgi:hypothetical protein
VTEQKYTLRACSVHATDDVVSRILIGYDLDCRTHVAQPLRNEVRYCIDACLVMRAAIDRRQRLKVAHVRIELGLKRLSESNGKL